MKDDDWEERRKRAILAAFQTGRPVFADSDGKMRYVDGDGKSLPDDIGMTKKPLPSATMKRTWWTRIKRWIGRRAS